MNGNFAVQRINESAVHESIVIICLLHDDCRFLVLIYRFDRWIGTSLEYFSCYERRVNLVRSRSRGRQKMDKK